MVVRFSSLPQGFPGSRNLSRNERAEKFYHRIDMDNGERMEDKIATAEQMDQRSDTSNSAGLVLEGRSVDSGAFVASYVSKETPGVKRIRIGKVASYDHGSGLYSIVYEDGNRENLDGFQVSKIVIAEDERAGSNMKLSCRKRKLDLLVSSAPEEAKVSPPRTRSRKIASDSSDGVKTSPGRLDSDISEDADSSSNSCDHAQAPSVTSIEYHSLELPPSSGDIAVPEESISYLFSVYSFLRSFSVQLFLSPFGLDELVGSLNCLVQNSLMDAIHLQLMRALGRHLQVLSSEGLELASKCLRHYDWSLLDALTWPTFVVEYLFIMGYTRSLGAKIYGAMLSDGEYYSLPLMTKLMVLQILCDDVIDSAELKAELEMRENLEDDEEGDTDVIHPLDSGSRNMQSKSSKNSASSSTLSLKDSKEQPNHKTRLKEIETDVDASGADIDGNSDECRLCGMDGTLICCDGCPSAYHSRCIGLNKNALPAGQWFCPECVVDKLGPTSFRVGRGIQGAELFGIDECGRVYLGTCNYLLVTGTLLNSDPFCRYYNQDDVLKVLSMMSSIGEDASSYAHIRNEISRHWEVPTTNSETEQIKPTGEIDVVVHNSDIEARVHSSILNSVSPCSFLDMQEYATSNSIASARKTEVTSLETTVSLNNREQLSSRITSEQVQKIFPDNCTRSSNHFVKESIMTTMLLSNLPSASQRLVAPSINEYITFRDSGISYVSNKNCAGGVFDRIQVRNDKVSSRRAYFNPQSYVNQYIHGDIAASAAANFALLTNEEKRFSATHASSNSRKTAFASIVLQLKAFSEATMYFLWPTFEKKVLDVPRERCGWCITCKGSITNKKGCFLNLAAANAIKGSARNINGVRPTRHYEVQFPVIAAHVANMEEKLRGLVAGPFVNAECNLHWQKRVREASSCRVLKSLLLEFEKSICGIAFSGAWFKLLNDGPFKFSSALIGASKSGPSQKRGPGRPSKKHSVPESSQASSEDSWKDVQWWRGGKLSKVILQYETLPSYLVRKVARQGGIRRIPSICYPESVELPKRSRQFAWRAAVQMCKNVSQLALQVRYLDSHIRWKDLVPPEQSNLDGKGSEGDASAFRNVVICDKRVYENKIMYAVVFSNQKHIPLKVMKNVVEKEIINNESSKFWFSEIHIPLYLVKDYEEKIGRKFSHGSMTSGSYVLPKLRKERVKIRRIDIFTYLLHKGEKPSTFCASCKEDVYLRDATPCSICEGKCHKDCAIPLIDRKGASLVYNFTCRTCYHDKKAAALNANRKEIFNIQPAVQNQYQPMLDRKLIPQTVVPDSVESTVILKDHQGIRSSVSSSKLDASSKRGTLNAYGLIWKRKKGNDTGTDFRLENIVLRSNEGIIPSRRPTCCLCNAPYRADLMYIRCEKCLKWHHADALSLEESQIFELVGFKCCRCRRKASPKCPYLNPDYKKPEPEFVGTGNILEGSKSDNSKQVHSSKPVSRMVNEGVVVTDDPLLRSSGIVEPLPVRKVEIEAHLSELVAQNQQKLSIRRPHGKYTTELCSDNQSPGRENTVCEMNNLTMANGEISASTQVEKSYDYQGGEFGAVSINDTDCDYQWHDQMCGNEDDTEFEPQTYFSFTELLASDDDKPNVLSDDRMDDSEIGWPSNCGETRSYGAPSYDEPPADNATQMVACDMCKLCEPPADLACEICGLLIHLHCSPWVESEELHLETNWRCGRCRDWR